MFGGSPLLSCPAAVHRERTHTRLVTSPCTQQAIHAVTATAVMISTACIEAQVFVFFLFCVGAAIRAKKMRGNSSKLTYRRVAPSIKISNM